MKILVCIKQVPDMASRFIVDSGSKWYDDTNLAYVMNEYDEYAIEESVRLKEQLGAEADITVLSIGPDRVVEVLRKALAMGCDRAVHILDPASRMRDPWQIASMIAAYARDKGFDLVFTGMQSQDRGSAQVGVTIAELLGMACTTTVVEFSYADRIVTARRELEGGSRCVVQLPPPALLTCQMGLNDPRYPTLPNILKAKKKEIVTLPAPDLLREKELTSTARMYHPACKSGGIVLQGGVNEMADQLLAILKERTMVVR